MHQYTVSTSSSGKRLDRFLFSLCSEFPGAAIHKAFKNKDVKVNGRREKENFIVTTGDTVTVFLPILRERSGEENLMDTFSVLAPSDPNETAKALLLFREENIFWENNDILVAIKPQGIPAQSDGASGFDIALSAWWAQNRPPLETGYPALCHRLDRNTGGLLLFAKTADALRCTELALKHHQIRKFYLCLVEGKPYPASTTVNAWLEKDSEKGRVYIHEAPKNGALPIETVYQTISTDGKSTLLKVEIMTGRTHQIRAQMARLGHPIIGDSKYGANKTNRAYRTQKQALWAYQIVFPTIETGVLQTVSEKTFANFSLPWKDLLTPRMQTILDDMEKAYLNRQASERIRNVT